MGTIRQSNHKGIKRYLIDPVVAVIVAVPVLLFRLLPLKIATAIGAGLGFLVGFIFKKRNAIAFCNLSIAFPEKNTAEKKKIIRQMWCHFGRFFAESQHLNKLLPRIDRENQQAFKVFENHPTGGFWVSAHIGNWELFSAVGEELNIQINPVYRPANNPWLEKLLFKKRKGILIPKGPAGARLILESLNNNQFVGLLCDQKLREGMSVPFFGKPAQTASAVASLSLKKNVPIYLACCVRKKNGRYLLKLSPKISINKTGDLQKDTYAILCQINQEIENWIRQYPEQWLWIHRRFDKSIYTSQEK